MTRVGGNTTEATTTSTTVVDLLSVASLSISAATPFSFFEVYRKSAGFAGSAGFGLKINTTEVRTPTAANNAGNVCGPTTTSDRAENGSVTVWLNPVVTSYTFIGASGRFGNWDSAGVSVAGANGTSSTAPQPNATRTDVIVNAISPNAAVTAGCDEMHIYTYATS